MLRRLSLTGSVGDAVTLELSNRLLKCSDDASTNDFSLYDGFFTILYSPTELLVKWRRQASDEAHRIRPYVQIRI